MTLEEKGVLGLALMAYIYGMALHGTCASSAEAADRFASTISYTVGPCVILLLIGTARGVIQWKGIVAIIALILVLMWYHDSNMKWYFHQVSLPKADSPKVEVPKAALPQAGLPK